MFFFAQKTKFKSEMSKFDISFLSAQHLNLYGTYNYFLMDEIIKYITLLQPLIKSTFL